MRPLHYPPHTTTRITWNSTFTPSYKGTKSRSGYTDLDQDIERAPTRITWNSASTPAKRSATNDNPSGSSLSPPPPPPPPPPPLFCGEMISAVRRRDCGRSGFPPCDVTG